MSGKRLPKGASTEIVAMIRDGLPYRQIADAFDVTTGTVTYYALRAGLSRQRGHVTDPRFGDQVAKCGRCGIAADLDRGLCQDCTVVLTDLGDDREVWSA